jgi:formyl-CoA transferase
LIAGPFCGQLLGDLGADVIKIELPRIGDPMRQWGKRGEGISDSVWWSVIGRNKRSLTLDLRTEEGVVVFDQLIRVADVMVENFRPGTLERWGIGPSVLLEANPSLVIARVSGFGQDGPYSQRAGYGSIGEAMGGLRAVTGFADRPPPRVGVSIGDSLAGLMATIGILAAFYAQQRTERAAGEVIDVSIFESVLAIMESIVSDYAVDGYTRPRHGTSLPGIAPSNLYQTADGPAVLIAANQDSVFERLCEAMNRRDLLDDERYRSHSSRGKHQESLDAVISEWAGALDRDTVLERLNSCGVPAGSVYEPVDMLHDEHYRYRQSIVEVDHPELGPIPVQGVFPKLSSTPGSVRWLGPSLGQHTVEILSDLLGMKESDIEALRESDVV